MMVTKKNVSNVSTRNKMESFKTSVFLPSFSQLAQGNEHTFFHALERAERKSRKSREKEERAEGKREKERRFPLPAFSSLSLFSSFTLSLSLSLLSRSSFCVLSLSLCSCFSTPHHSCVSFFSFSHAHFFLLLPFLFFFRFNSIP